MNDSMDVDTNDFEFKPLTEGLGFHKKAEKIKKDVKTSNLASSQLSTHASTSSARGTTSLSSESSRTISTETSLRSSLFKDEVDLSPKESRPASQSISDLIASLPPSLDFIDEKPEPASKVSSKSSSKASMTSTSPLKAGSSLFEKETPADRPQIFQPLGRDDYKSPVPASAGTSAGPTIGSMLPQPGSKASSIAPAVPVVPAPTKIAPPSPYRERLDESFARAFPHAEKSKKEAGLEENAEGLQAATVNLVSGFLDGMVVAGVSVILLVAILAITRVNLVGLLSNAHTDMAVQLNLLLLFVAVLQMYMLISRSFFGATLGEWAFDLQMGSNADRAKLTYPLKVAWRTLLVSISGLIILPLLSAVTGRDLAAPFTGLQLYRTDG